MTGSSQFQLNMAMSFLLGYGAMKESILQCQSGLLLLCMLQKLFVTMFLTELTTCSEKKCLNLFISTDLKLGSLCNNHIINGAQCLFCRSTNSVL